MADNTNANLDKIGVIMTQLRNLAEIEDRTKAMWSAVTENYQSISQMVRELQAMHDDLLQVIGADGKFDVYAAIADRCVSEYIAKNGNEGNPRLECTKAFRNITCCNLRRSIDEIDAAIARHNAAK